MNLLNWIRTKVGGETKVTMEEFFQSPEAQSALSDFYMRELAFWTCVNKIAGAISKCEIKVYANGAEKQEDEYYLWNYEPNQNQNSVAFFRKLIGNLYSKNEVLVIENGNHLYVADSFSKEVYALKEYSFQSVTVDNFTFDKTFYQSEVLYWKLNNQDMKALLNGMSESYGKLISYASKAYLKSRGNRGILNIDAVAQADQNFKTRFETLMTEHFKTFFSSENAVLPLFNGYSYTDLSNSSKTYTTESTRDIKSLYDDIFEFTARAFSFPPSLAKGDVQDTSKATDELLTFCIDPLARMLETEINRKRNGLEGFKRGNRIRIDTTAVKHIDIFDIATPIDKLISSGAFTINDIRKTIGESPLAEDWADRHFMTKNYSTVEELLKAIENQEGG